MSKRLLTIVLALAVMFAAISCKEEQNTERAWELSSPSGKLTIHVALDSANKLFYHVGSSLLNKEVIVIGKSPLGLSLANQQQVYTFVSKDSVKTVDENYQLLTGKQLNNRNYCRELTLTFNDSTKNRVNIVVRAYDDGVAFRYVLPGDGEKEQTINGEFTGFKVNGGEAWIQPYDTVTKWTPAYERYYSNRVTVGETSPMANGWCFPALFHSQDHWLLLTESDLDGSYFGSHLNAQAPDGLYTIRQPEKEEGLGTGYNIARTKGEIRTPWRVIQVAQTPGGIVESNLVFHLAAPSKISNIQWIRPGRASWSWWGDHDSSQDLNKLKKFVDLAAEMKWEYSLVDANWNVMKGGTLEQLAEYAKSKGVGLLVWYNSGGPHNEVTEQPRDIMYNAEQRKAEMKRLHDMGVKGIKVDFFQTDKQHIIQQYIDILNDAAEQEILVNFHGCTIPRGWARTWPNLVSMESVKGAESYSFASDYPQSAPLLNTILPYTRNVIGSMDYTPVTFGDQTYPHLTTNAHELALAIVFESGIVHMADRVDAYRRLPSAPKRLLMEIPVTWDETRWVSGMPGEDIVIARRKGDVWYVAGINGENKTKSLSPDISFIGDGNFNAALISDGARSGSFDAREFAANKDTKQAISIQPFGGFVMRLEKQ